MDDKEQLTADASRAVFELLEEAKKLLTRAIDMEEKILELNKWK